MPWRLATVFCCLFLGSPVRIYSTAPCASLSILSNQPPKRYPPWSYALSETKRNCTGGTIMLTLERYISLKVDHRAKKVVQYVKKFIHTKRLNSYVIDNKRLIESGSSIGYFGLHDCRSIIRRFDL